MVYEEYIDRDTGGTGVCYGRIHSIIEHSLYPDCPDTLRNVLIECDWYTATGVTTPSGLLQVSYDAALSKTSRWTFLKNMHRANVALWPSYSKAPSFEVIPDTYAVVEHTLEDIGGSDSEDESDEEGARKDHY